MGTFDSFLSFQYFMLASNLLVPLFVTALFMPSFIEKLIENNIVAKDQYKRNPTLVADRGSVVILLIAKLCLSLGSLFFKFVPTNELSLDKPLSKLSLLRRKK